VRAAATGLGHVNRAASTPAVSVEECFGRSETPTRYRSPGVCPVRTKSPHRHAVQAGTGRSRVGDSTALSDQSSGQAAVAQPPCSTQIGGLRADIVPGSVAPARVPPLSRARFHLRPQRIPAGALRHRVVFRVLPRVSCLPGLTRPQRAICAARAGSAPHPARRALRSGQEWRGSPWALRCWPRCPLPRRSGRRSSRRRRTRARGVGAQVIERRCCRGVRSSAGVVVDAASPAGCLPRPDGVHCTRRWAFGANIP
jgi:hypothetical protein